MIGAAREWGVWVLAVGWLATVAAGFAAWERYETTPGEVRAPEVNRVPQTGRWRLVMFVHPHCPCSRASLDELAGLLAKNPIEAEVVFVRPAGVCDGWERTDLWRAAAAIPGVRVECDPDGSVAHRAGAMTSGHAVLSDPDGRVVFCGGITAARGRSGESPGQQMIRERVTGRATDFGSEPVYGCPLFSSRSCDAKSGECR